MLPGHHAKSPSKDRLCARESRTNDRREDPASGSPAPAKPATGSRDACPCSPSQAKPGHQSGLESSQSLQPSHDPQQRRHVNTAINDDPPSVPTHDLNPSRISCSTLTRRCRLPLHKHGHKPDGVGRSKPPLAKRLAPGKQQLVGNPVSSRRRRGLPWAGMALLHNPELRFVRPPTSPAGVDYFQADDLMIVLMHVHKVNQLHPRPASQGGLPRRRTFVLRHHPRTVRHRKPPSVASNQTDSPVNGKVIFDLIRQS